MSPQGPVCVPAQLACLSRRDAGGHRGPPLRLPLRLVLFPPRRERRVFGGESGSTTVVIYQAGNIPILCLAKATEIGTAQRQCIELKKEIKVFRPHMIVISEETLLQCDCFYIGEMDCFQLAQQITDILIVFSIFSPDNRTISEGFFDSSEPTT